MEKNFKRLCWESLTSDKENKTLKNFLKQLLSFVLLSTKTPFFVLFCPSAIIVKKKQSKPKQLCDCWTTIFFICWRERKSFFSLSMPRAFQKLPFFCLFYPLHKAFAFFFVVQVKQKEKNFHFVMKLTEQTTKADKQLKNLFLFFVRFNSNKQKGTVFLHCWCFFLTDGNVFVF